MEEKTRHLMILLGDSEMIKNMIDTLVKVDRSKITIITTRGSSNPKVNERTLSQINEDSNLDEKQKEEELRTLPQKAFVRAVGAGDEFIVIDNTGIEIIPEDLYTLHRKLFDYKTEIIRGYKVSLNISIPLKEKSKVALFLKKIQFWK